MAETGGGMLGATAGEVDGSATRPAWVAVLRGSTPGETALVLPYADVAHANDVVTVARAGGWGGSFTGRLVGPDDARAGHDAARAALDAEARAVQAGTDRERLHDRARAVIAGLRAHKPGGDGG